jgi:hypothetical protein
MVCLLEQGVYRITGRRVEGTTGRMWFLGWMLFLSRGLVEGIVDSGQAEGLRMKLEVGGWSLYPMDHVVEFFGWTVRGP